jgi:hypothetical protein
MLFYRRRHGSNSVKFNNIGFAVEAANQHHNGFPHEGMVVNDKNAHGFK